MGIKMKEFYKVLRQMGFKRKYRGYGLSSPHVYEKEFSDRTVDVQLWVDGKHRASNMHDTPYGKRGQMDTYPTDFKTVDGMIRAIEFEASRKDIGVGSKYQHMVETP